MSEEAREGVLHSIVKLIVEVMEPYREDLRSRLWLWGHVRAERTVRGNHQKTLA